MSCQIRASPAGHGFDLTRRNRPLVVRVNARLFTNVRFASLCGAFTPAATNFGHVMAIDADLFTALSTRGTGLIGRKFMGLALLMGGTSALAGNFALTMGIHRCKPTVFCA